jgi:hypothetical protein
VKLLNLSALLRRWALKLLNFAPALRAGGSKSSYSCALQGPPERSPLPGARAAALCGRGRVAYRVRAAFLALRSPGELAACVSGIDLLVAAGFSQAQE